VGGQVCAARPCIRSQARAGGRLFFFVAVSMKDEHRVLFIDAGDSAGPVTFPNIGSMCKFGVERFLDYLL